MPRRWKERVRPFPKLRPGRSYPVRVTHIAKAGGSSARFAVRGQHLSQEQAGRELEFQLEYPIRPSGSTADFFHAAGLDVVLDQAVYPEDVVGRLVAVIFEAGDDKAPAVKSFKPHAQEESHVADEHESRPSDAAK